VVVVDVDVVVVDVDVVVPNDVVDVYLQPEDVKIPS